MAAGLVLAFCVTWGWIVVSGPAAALSCAQPPGWTPEAIVAGEEPHLRDGSRFSDLYDVAVVGEVRGIVTNEDGKSENYGQTRSTVDVRASFGSESLSETITVTSPDPGWLSGYPFEKGRMYFIPLRLKGGGTSVVALRPDRRNQASGTGG